MPLDIGGSLYCYKGSGQCNNYHGREDCAERWSYSSSPEESWSDTLCSESHFWICEKVSITKTQSHTVQLKFNRSELLPYRKWHLCHLTWVFIMLKLLSNPNVANIKLCWLLGLKITTYSRITLWNGNMCETIHSKWHDKWKHVVEYVWIKCLSHGTPIIAM